jgi:EthD domain
VFKVMAYLKRKAGISRRQFIEYYERHHQKLALEILPPIVDYRRNYPVYDDPMNSCGAFDADGACATAGDNPEPVNEFDVITELTFNNRAEYEHFIEVLRSPHISRLIAEDEDQFMERSGSRRVIVVEEYRSPPA